MNAPSNAQSMCVPHGKLAMHGRTDGRTNEEGLSPTRDNQTSVTRAPAYEISPILDTASPAYVRLEAEAILRQLGPDPDAAIHWAEVYRGLGVHCMVTDCLSSRHSGGMCRPHYDRLKSWARANEAYRINRRAS